MAAKARFGSFAEFYRALYLKEHASATSRALHAGGTLLFGAYCLAHPRALLSIATALAAGHAVRVLTRQHATGLVEMAGMLGTFLAMQAAAYGWSAPAVLANGAAPMALGYGPAWVGHYFFEGNRPATFVHPVFSFQGDIVMCADYLLGRLPPPKSN